MVHLIQHSVYMGTSEIHKPENEMILYLLLAETVRWKDDRAENIGGTIAKDATSDCQ